MKPPERAGTAADGARRHPQATTDNLCSGNIILPCDQDDVWLPDKIAKIEAAFIDFPSVGLVFSNSALVDVDLKPLGRELYGRARRSTATLYVRGAPAIESVRATGLVAGHTMAFRGLPPLLKPWGAIADTFDVSRSIVAAAISDCIFIPQALTLYRRHSNQQTACKMDMSSAFDGTIDTHIKLERTFASVLEWAKAVDLPSEILQVLASYREMAFFMLTLPPSRVGRALPILRKLLAGKYHRFANGYRTAARDFLVPIPVLPRGCFPALNVAAPTLPLPGAERPSLLPPAHER